MFEVAFNFDPSIEQLKNWVKTVERAALEDLRPFWEKWATPIVIEELARIFATNGYGKWPPLSPGYAKYKARRYPGRTILRREDNYWRAATTKKHAGNVHIYGKDNMSWGIDLGWFASKFGFPYPAVHESGDTRGVIPQRSVFKTAEESALLQTHLVFALNDYMRKVIRRETRRHFGSAA
jgi:hypothetical protein